MTRQEQMHAVLDQLVSSMAQDISGVAVVGIDGIILVSRLANDVNIERIGAVAATMLGVTKRVAGELRLGKIEETILKSENGLFLVLPIGTDNLLAINLRRGGNLGMVRLEAHDATTALSRVIFQ